MQNTKEDFTNSVTKVEKQIDLVNIYTSEIMTDAKDIANIVSHTKIALKQIDKDMKFMELSFQAYMKSADVSLKKIEYASKALEGINKRMDLSLDKILSIDINSNSEDVVKLRSILIDSLNQNLNVVANSLIAVFNA